MFSDYWFDLGGIPTILINNAKQLVDHKIINPFSNQNLFIVDKNKFLSPQSLDSMISPVLLFQTGYLTIARSFTNQVYLKFPNLELKRAFNTLQSSYLFNDDSNSLLQSQNGEAVIYNDASVCLDFNCSVDTLKSFFNQILNLIPYNQFSLNDEAAVASSIFLYLKGRDLICEAESQNCIGRSDLKLYLDSHQVFIFEFKYLPENATASAKDLLDKAQEQILTQRYAAIADTKVRAFALVYSQKEKQLCLMSEIKL
ncbi:MAG: PD-(D/E)XK nuclease domain-containing protein, partial [Succinivibrio sp.]|nr:PD-(D/E)XK nuclease domain-containing protein [Succinivibrio sp.]